MIKFFTIIVLLAVGLQCKVLPDEVPAPIIPEDQTVDKSDISQEDPIADNSNNAASKNYSADSKSTQENSKEATVEEKENTDKSDKSEVTEERGDAESGSSERHQRSTDDKSKSGKKDETKTANVDDGKAAARTSDLEKSGDSSKLGADDTECGKCSRRNSKENNSPATAARTASFEVKLGSINTETAERDDASHTDIKESKQAPKEGNIETPGILFASEENSKTGSVENMNSESAPDESKSASQESQLKTAKQDENERSSTEAEEDAKSDLLSDVGVEALVRSDFDDITEISPAQSLRMLHQNYNLREAITEPPETAAETRMAPREDESPSGHQVDPFGNTDSGQSDYPYSPLENLNTDIPTYLARSSPADKKNMNDLKSSLPLWESNKPFKFLPPLPSLEQNGGLKPLPPLKPMKPFKPLPPLRPLEPMKPFEQLPPLRPLDNPRGFLPPMQNFGTFKPLPPLRPFVMHRPFEPLPPLPPLPSLESIGPFKPLPPLRPLDHREPTESFPSPDRANLLKAIHILQQQLQQSPNLLSALTPQSHNLKISPIFSLSPGMSSMSRQAGPEALPQTEGLSRSWHAAVATPTTAMSFSRSVDYK